MASAAPVIRAKADNPRLMKEIGAWVDAFEQLGRAYQHAVAALEENNAGEAVTHLVQATRALVYHGWNSPAAITRKGSCTVPR